MTTRPNSPDFPNLPDFGQMIAQACEVIANVRGIPYDFNGALSLENKFTVLFKTVKEMFDAQDTLAKSYKELYEFVNQYFDSLDVQTAVNNKLNDMVKDGTFAQLFGDNVMTWDSAEGNILVDAKISNSVFDGYSQGMCSDGTYIYLTHRKTLNNSKSMYIAKLDSNLNVISDYNVGSGHFNNLYYYDGIIYASGTLLTAAGNPKYSSFSMFDASTLTKIRDINVPAVGAWGVGLRKFQNITAPTFFINQQNTNCFDVYTGFSGQYTETQTLANGTTETIKIQDNQKEYSPLTRIVLKTGNLGVWQGAFTLTQNYIFTVESVLGKEAPFAKNRIGVYEYNGNNHCYLYLPSTLTDEIEDIEVIGAKVYVNTARCKIVSFDMPTFYHGYDTQINAVNALNGLLKNAYLNNNLDRYRSFNGIKIFGEHFANELVYEDEQSNMHGTVSINDRKFDISTSPNNKILRVTGTVYFQQTFMNIYLEYSLRSKSNNYVYKLTYISAFLWSSAGTEVITGTESNGDLFSNPTTSGSIANAFYKLVGKGWITKDLYLNRLQYTVNINDNYSGFKLNPDGALYDQGSDIKTSG